MLKIAYKVKCQVTNEWGTSDLFVKINGKYYKTQEVYDKYIENKNKKKVICFYTKEEGYNTDYIKINNKYFKSQEVYNEYLKQLQDKKDIFDTIYEILGYNEKQVLPNDVTRKIDTLIGVLNSKFLYYRYDIILTTFKLYKSQIKQCIGRKDFKNEIGKINYIFVVIQNNINDVYLRIQKANKAKEKTENVNTLNIEHSGAEYKPKTKEVKNKRINDLWE